GAAGPGRPDRAMRLAAFHLRRLLPVAHVVSPPLARDPIRSTGSTAVPVARSVWSVRSARWARAGSPGPASPSRARQPLPPALRPRHLGRRPPGRGTSSPQSPSDGLRSQSSRSARGKSRSEPDPSPWAREETHEEAKRAPEPTQALPEPSGLIDPEHSGRPPSRIRVLLPFTSSPPASDRLVTNPPKPLAGRSHPRASGCTPRRFERQRENTRCRVMERVEAQPIVFRG